MLSVTSETATSVSFPNTRPTSERDDRSASDTFGALIDINAQASQASTAQTPNLSDQHDMRPDRLANASRPGRTVSADDDTQTRGSQTSSGRPQETDSAGSGTGIQKPAAGTEASGDTHHRRAKHEDTKVAVSGGASDSKPAASEATTADPVIPFQPVTTPVAAAVPATIPVAASPSAAAAPAATAATLSATVAGTLPAQAISATQAPPADTGFALAVADTTTTAMAIPTGGALAAAVAAATPADAKTTAKILDNIRPGKIAAPVAELQPGSMVSDATVTSSASSGPVQPHDAAPADHKHDAVATDNAKAAASDPGTPAAQPGTAAPQHPASTADATVAQPQIVQPDSSQPQGINSALAQPQMQSTAASAPVAPQLNVALAAGAAVPLSGLAVQIAVTARSGNSRFEIRLDPADLGRIDVRLDVDRQGKVTSHLTVDKPETLAMLRQDAPQLQRALQDAGLKTGDGGLQFSLRDQSSQGQNARDDTSRNAQRLIVTEDDVVPAVTAGRNYGRILGSSRGLDIRV